MKNSVYKTGSQGASYFSRFILFWGISIFAFSIPFVTLLIHTNPSTMPPKTPFSGWVQALSIMAGSFLLLFFASFLLLKIKKKGAYLVTYTISFISFTALSIYLGLNIHRDFFTSIFQLILIFWLLFIAKNELFSSILSKKRYYDFLFILNTIIFSTALLWIILMGYAIATRQEPRWAESLVYNVYNLILVFLLGAVSLRLRLERFRNVHVSADGSLYIDDYNFTGYFNDIEKKIVIFFLSEEKPVTCRMLEELFSEKLDAENRNLTVWDCGDCLKEKYTTTRCPKYKKIYNRVLSIKKLFETLEIGDIITPENKMRIKEEGWKLRLFDDVHVQHRR